MSTTNRLVTTDYDRDMAARLVAGRSPPFTLTITDGKSRTKAQNRLLHKWMGEIAEQKGDSTAEEIRAYCKLTIGVPILRQHNEAFRARYDEILKPLSYPQKIALMSEPLNLPVTSLMTTKQLTEYLETVNRHFAEQGVVLTFPDDLRNEIYPNSGEAPSSPSPDKAGGDQAPNTPPANKIDEEREAVRRFAKCAYGEARTGAPVDERVGVLKALAGDYLKDVTGDREKAVNAVLAAAVKLARRDMTETDYIAWAAKNLKVDQAFFRGEA